MITTQGWNTLGHLARHERWGPAHLGRAARDLVSHGFHYHESFGPGGDFGVESPGEWGMAYMTLDWLLERAGDPWTLARYAPGRNEGDQDVVVLSRSSASA